MPQNRPANARIPSLAARNLFSAINCAHSSAL
jgi:hypothetical protein